MVAGLPSGGTSLVAGVLHHLGVNMGEVPTVAQLKKVNTRRNYQGFECLEALRTFGGLPSNVSPERMMDTARTYIDKRLAEANGQRCGVKLNLFSLLAQCEGLEDLPLDVVHVKRNLAWTFASDIKYTGIDYQRAALRGVLHLALKEFVRRVPPVCILHYEDAICRPGVQVARLTRRLKLKPDVWQTEAAIRFIDPVDCKWQPERMI